MLQTLVQESHLENDSPSNDLKPNISGIPLFEALPSWAIYPDLERAEWINLMLSRFWPNISRHCENKVKITLQKKVTNKF